MEHEEWSELRNLYLFRNLVTKGKKAVKYEIFTIIMKPSYYPSKYLYRIYFFIGTIESVHFPKVASLL